MTVTRLIWREMWHRKLSFSLGAVSVAVAVGVLVAQVALLKKHDLRTEQLLAEKEADTKTRLQKYEDDVRKITVKMGFNILILPKDQALADLHDEDKLARTMPEDYAAKLARTRVATINHVLPTLTRKIKWPERERKVILMGVKGEVYLQSASQKPILEAVAPGQMVVGSELHRSLSLKTGQPLRFMGRDFKISKLMEERGSSEDITLWINLNEAQELLQAPGVINAILALECNCSPDRLAKIREEISALLPDTRVIEFASQALGRAEARNRAAQQAAEELQQEREGRAHLRAQRESFAAVLTPAVFLASGVWIALLTWVNVRDRRTEIGVLRALGVRSSQVLLIFVGKAALMGLVGAVVGEGVGLLCGGFAGEPLPQRLQMGVLCRETLLLVLAAAPILTVVASWIPALLATQQDPALVLQEE